MACVGLTQCKMSYLRGVWRNECAMQGLADIILSRNKFSIAKIHGNVQGQENVQVIKYIRSAEARGTSITTNMQKIKKSQ